MQAETAANVFFIWGVDDSPYGPVELPVLVDWIRDERVVPESWVFARRDGCWRRAADLPELKVCFNRKNRAAASAAPGDTLNPGSLRRIKILADLKDAQLAHLMDFLELQRVKQWTVVVHQGDPGDGMFLVLEGELRARVRVGDQEMILATFGTGEFFGDMSLFDQGPRSADVVANVDSVVLKMSASGFDRLAKEAPALATPFLQATARTLSARIRADNKRLNQVTRQFSASA